MSDSDAWLAHVLDRAFGSENLDRIAIAVSGGSDSLALLHLAVDWGKTRGIGPSAVTVDHGLRPEAADEAQEVGRICRGLGVDHLILKWQGWDGSGNLQDQARRARYRLIADWAKAQGIGAVALAHTADDQAETFLMRLARGAGVDGLSGMQRRRDAQGIIWLRPLLQVERSQLRNYLTGKGVRWIDDPSNEDGRYERIKARQVLAALAPLDIDAHVLSGVAQNLRDGRDALEVQTKAAADSVATIDAGDVVFDRAGLMSLPVEITRRSLVHAVKWVSSAEYGPRGTALSDALASLTKGTDSTLHGCHLLAGKTELRVTRELQAVKDLTCPPEAVWDSRWQLSGPENNGLAISALGEEGLRLCPDWRETGRPRVALLATPAVWRKQELVAAPLAGLANGWTAQLIHPPNHFNTSVLSH